MPHPGREELLADLHAKYIAAISQVGPGWPPGISRAPCPFLLHSEGKASAACALVLLGLPPSCPAACPPATPPHHRPQSKDSFEFFATEHFRMSGVYWGLTALALLGRLEGMDRTEVVAWVLSCQKESGGFGGSERHDAHLLYTLSALQVGWG